MAKTRIGFLLPFYMRATVRSILPSDSDKDKKDIFSLAEEASDGCLIPFFSKEADQWKTPTEITEDKVLKAYNELVSNDAKYVLVFGDDASAKLFDVFKQSPQKEKVSTATVLTGIDVDRGELNKHLKFWFTQEYETLILFNWLFKQRNVLVTNSATPKVGLAALDAKAPLEHCEIFRRLVCDQYGIFEFSSLEKWKFNHELNETALVRLLNTDAVFISGYADGGHISLINYLAEHNYCGYVFTNVALSLGEEIASNLQGRGGFPFRDNALYYTGIGLENSAIFYRNLVKTVFGYFGYLARTLKQDWHLVRTYVSPFGVLNIADSGNMSIPLALWKMFYDDNAQQWEQHTVDAPFQSQIGLTEISKFLQDINFVANAVVKDLMHDNGGNDFAHAFYDSTSSIKKLIGSDSSENIATALLCTAEKNNSMQCLSKIGDADIANGVNAPLLELMKSYVMDFGQLNAPLQINLSFEDIPDNSVERMWLDSEQGHLSVVQWLASNSCTPTRFAITRTREVLFPNRFSQINFEPDTFDGIKNVFNTAIGNGNNFIYCIPCISGDDYGMLLLVVEKKLSAPVLQVFSTATRQLLSIYYNERKRTSLREANVKSAIGSIMSRNGSHNIGSHVLSALSHNVGTMPDDRVLYQYIQHRMDYIASATTGAPDWSVPTPFVGNLMKMLYSQRHLLEHIAESDGLHAYQYQGKGTQIGEGQKNCVKIIVRRTVHSRKEDSTPPGEGWTIFLCPNEDKIYCYDFFAEKEKGGVDWLKDEDLAIPGGILGQHAFYNIIENIIRNAAKHSWAGKSENERGATNLEIYVDFEKQQKDGVMCFTVGDNMSKLFPGEFWKKFFKFLEQEKKNNRAPIPEEYVQNGLNSWPEVFAQPLDGFTVLTEEAKKKLPSGITHREYIAKYIFGDESFPEEGLPRCYTLLLNYVQTNWEDLKKDKFFMSCLQGKDAGDKNKTLGRRLPLPLHHRQEIALAKPFIDLETNQLRQSAWGLSEMKISAGYLRRAQVSVIGGLKDCKPGEHPLILPMGIPRNEKAPGAQSPDDTSEKTLELSYENLCLAYRFWITLPKDVLIVADNPTHWERFKQWEGIGVESYANVFGDGERQKKGDIGLMSDYGFVLIDHIKGKEKREEEGKNDKWEKDDKLKLPFRALEIAGDPQKGALSLPCVPEGALIEARTHKEFVECVYREWLEYLKTRRGQKAEHPLTIKLNIYEKEGGEKGLISDRDIYKVLFRECLHSVLEPMTLDAGIDEWQRKALLLVSLYPLNDNDKLFDDVNEKVMGDHQLKIESLLGQIAAKVLSFWDALPCANEKECDPLQSLRDAYRVGLESAKKHMRYPYIALDLLSELDTIRDKVGHGGDSRLRRELDAMAKNPSSTVLNAAAEALEVARTTSDVFLRKYEERIATLPQQYKGVKKPKETHLPFAGFGVDIVCSETGKEADISYNRHATDGAKLYSEPLSGSQTYLNALSNLSPDDSQWAMRLAENGLLRIAIIDERVRAFIAAHGEDIRKTYESMHIAVMDTEQVPTINADKTEFPDLMKLPYAVKNADDTDFDLVVIHQGIIDKWWQNKHGKKDVASLLRTLRAPEDSSRGTAPPRFVVVTTGRGRPDNIPDNEKVLAFSSIEAFLFKRYPEKLNLVNSLMNILPGSPERNDDND